jgi:hypothetical protein
MLKIKIINKKIAIVEGRSRKLKITVFVINGYPDDAIDQ